MMKLKIGQLRRLIESIIKETYEPDDYEKAYWKLQGGLQVADIKIGQHVIIRQTGTYIDGSMGEVVQKRASHKHPGWDISVKIIDGLGPKGEIVSVRPRFLSAK